MTICDLYLRLSDGRRENGSFTEREAALRARAAQLGWTVYRTVVENDVGADGKVRNASAWKRRKVTLPDGSTALRVIRPGFRSVLADLTAGSVLAILAEDLDRAVRDPRDAEDLVDAVRLRGGWADSLSGSLRLTAGGTDAEILMLRVATSVASKSSSDTARRVADGRERTAGAGRWGGGRRPYGFTPVAEESGTHRNTRLVVDPVEAAEIVRAAQQILSVGKDGRRGVPLKAVAKDMRDRGVPTVTGVPWTAETLRDVLLRPLNSGIVTLRGQETDVRLSGDPILTEDVWRGVVAVLRDPDRATPGRAPCWLGTNLYKCVCGSVMEIQGGKGRARSYRCSVGGPGVHVRRAAEPLDAYVAAALVKLLASSAAVGMFSRPSGRDDLAALRQQAKALRERLDEYARDYADDAITRAQMIAGTKRTRARLDEIEGRLSASVSRSPVDGVAGAPDVADRWVRLSLGQRREILATLATVTVLPAGRGRGFDPAYVRIDWTP